MQRSPRWLLPGQMKKAQHKGRCQGRILHFLYSVIGHLTFPALVACLMFYPLSRDWLFRSLSLVAIASLLGDQSLYSHKSHNVHA